MLLAFMDLLNNYREELAEGSAHAANPRYILAKGRMDQLFQAWVTQNSGLVRQMVQEVKAKKLTAEKCPADKRPLPPLPARKDAHVQLDRGFAHKPAGGLPAYNPAPP
jgi:hypothetical protein